MGLETWRSFVDRWVHRAGNRLALLAPRFSPITEPTIWLILFLGTATLAGVRWQTFMVLDISLLRWVNQAIAHPFLDELMNAFSSMGKHPLTWLALLSWFAVQARRKGSSFQQRVAWWFKVVLVLGLAISVSDVLCGHIIKPLVKRQRPAKLVKGLRTENDVGKAFSFPSAHASNAFSAARMLSELTQPKALWWALAVTISFSRVYLGAHFPSDVVGGALFGLFVGSLTVALGQTLSKLTKFSDRASDKSQ